MFLTKTNKSPYFQLTYEVNGKRTTISTRTADRQQAENFMRTFNISAHTSQDSAVPQVVEKREISVAEFQAEYTQYLAATKTPNYVRSVNLSFKMLLSFTGNIKLNMLQPRLADSFISTTFQRTKRSAALYYRTLKAAFNTALKWEYIQSNPFVKVKLPKLPQSLPTFITVEQLNTILSHTSRTDIQMICLMAFYTGMRINEILNMQWNAIDMQAKMIHIRNTSNFTTKSKRERIIPIAQNLFTILSSMYNNQPGTAFLFTDKRRQKYNANFISKEFKKLVRKAKLDESIHFHTLRHSFASNLVQRGASIYIVKELLGHEDVKTTMVYSHLDSASLQSAVNLL